MKNCCVVLRYGSNAIFLGSVEASDVNVSSNITSYPIYSGDTVGEHMIREPITVSLRGSYAVNGSDGILINNDVPSLKRFQQEMEAIRDNGTLCDYYKIAYNPSDPRFVKRTGMALKNISWVEHFNSLEFSLSFQQVFVASVASGPSIYAGQSNYSNGSEQMPGSYNPNTGVVTDLPTGQTANTSRAPGEVSYDDFGITEKNDEYIPDLSEPYSANFIETYLDKKDMIAAIIAFCYDEGVVDQAFITYVQGLPIMTNGGIVVSAISAALIAIGAAGVYGSGPTAAVASALALGHPAVAGVIGGIGLAFVLTYVITAIYKRIQIDNEKRRFKKAVFRISGNNENENKETVKRFTDFVEQIYEQLLVYDNAFLVYEFPIGESQQAVINVDGNSLKVDVVKDYFGMTMNFICNGITYAVRDPYSSAKKDYSVCTNSNTDFVLRGGNKQYYGYILAADRMRGELMENIRNAKSEASNASGTKSPVFQEDFGGYSGDPRDFVLVISSMQPSDFANEIANTVCNYIYTNYQDVIGEG